MTKKKAEVEQAEKFIMAYKAFDPELKCRGYQYEIGKTYEHKGSVEACSSGFHACENPFDVLSYYSLYDSRFAAVKAGGAISRHGKDSKIASAKITIEAELKLPEFVKACVDWLLAAVAKKSAPDAAGDNGEEYSKLAASGNDSKLAASGNYSKLAASGNDSQLAASGNYSKLAASGYASQLAASGNDSQLAASGNYSKLAASGNDSKLAASGYASQLAASGERAVVASAEHVQSFTLGVDGCIALPFHDGKRTRFVTAYVGEDGIEPGVAYKLDGAGKVVRA